MATTTKTKVAAPVEAANESDILKETIAKQQAQMQEMMAQIALLMKADRKSVV